MKVQINSDSSINKDLSTKKYVAGEVNRVFKRYSAKLTRVEVHLTDVNRGKSGTHDKRCTVEVRPAEHRPLTVSNGARTIKESLGGALTKMRSALETFFGRTDARRGAGAVKTKMLTATSVSPTRVHRLLLTETVPAKPVAAVKPRRAAATTRTAAKPRTVAKPRVAVAKTANGRSPKKKAIFQARRKSWPTR